MTTEGLKSWIIIMAVLVLVLVYLAQTGDGSLSFDFSRGAVLSSAVTRVANDARQRCWGRHAARPL